MRPLMVRDAAHESAGEDRSDQLPHDSQGREARKGIAWLRGVRAAVTLLTRVPVGGFPYTNDELRWASAHLPFVGALIGGVLGAVWMLSSRAGALVAAVVVVVVSLLLTGAMHEDGLADTADALGGGATRERVLSILKDSRIGTFGGAALVATLLLRVALLARLGNAAPVALVFVASASRLAPVWLMFALPYVTEAGVAKHEAIARTGRMEAAVATLWFGAVAIALGATHALEPLAIGVMIASGIVTTALAGARFRARVGGITGDFLGAAQQITECSMLLALAIARGGPL
jgi:adenosylcobinamide-GDP ribazoletransferase